MTFAAACGDEVPEGYQHPFCIPCMVYAGAPPCCTGDQQLCDVGKQMSGLSLREYFNDVDNTTRSYRAGEPREERQVLQLVRPSDVADNTESKDHEKQVETAAAVQTKPLEHTQVTETTIAQVCQRIVCSTKLGSSTTISSQEITRDARSLVTPTHLMPRMSRYRPIPKGHHLQIIPALLTPFTRESQSDISSITRDSAFGTTQGHDNDSTISYRGRSEKREDLNRSPQKRRSKSASPVLMSSRTEAVTCPPITEDTPAKQDESGETTIPADVDSSASDDELMDESRELINKWFAGEEIHQSLSRINPAKFKEAMLWLLQHQDYFHLSLLKGNTARAGPACIKLWTMNQTGWGYGGAINAHLYNIAQAMKRAGFANTDYLPPMERHVLARGYLTLENPKLLITNLLFPHSKKNPWCIDSPRPHLDCKPTHQTVANWEQSVLFSVHAVSLIRQLLSVRNHHDVKLNDCEVNQQAIYAINKAIHALNAVYVHLIMRRRRDVIRTDIPVTVQFDLLGRPITGTSTLIDLD